MRFFRGVFAQVYTPPRSLPTEGLTQQPPAPIHRAHRIQGRIWLVGFPRGYYSELMNDANTLSSLPPPEVCRTARLSRDRRFDGEFFLGVKTTGIYCRPVCPARSPREANVQYFRSAAEAAARGFRPCLRCRPESAPDSPAWKGTATTVERALRLIREGALNESNVAELSARLGVGERYLRKLFARELGVSPIAVAQNQRLLFARKLLFETNLPVTEVAWGAGYKSIRRFNSAMRDHFACSPQDMRRGKASATGSGISLLLTYRPPYDWAGVADFFSRHAITGLECVDDGGYWRRIEWQGESGTLSLTPELDKSALRLTVDLPDTRGLMSLVARVRRMFDLDANPAAIAQTLSTDSLLASLVEQYPGVRAPVQLTPYEAGIRAIIGQQVSIAAARGVCQRLAEACSDGNTLAFPSPDALLRLPDNAFPMPGRRKATLRAYCELWSREESGPSLADIAALPGVGPWTQELIAMRGLGDPDCLPRGDLGLERAFEALGGERKHLVTHAEIWQPWRTYAANLLWRSLSP